MKFSYLNSYLDSICNEKHIPGVGISVYRHGNKVHEYCSGYADISGKKPFGMDTIVNLYSCSKVSTACAGMILVERGLLDLDAPVYQYLPEMKDITVRTPEESIVKAENPMLISHLFSMQAGFSYSYGDAFRDYVLKEYSSAPTIREFVSELSRQPLLFHPGTHFKYSYCIDVLGAVIEVVSQMRLSDFLEKTVFYPLGMEDTGFRINDEQRTRLAPEHHNYDSVKREYATVILKEGVNSGYGKNIEFGGAGIMSTVKDYGILAATLANNGVSPNGYRLLRPETIAQMQENRLSEDSMHDFNTFSGICRAGYGYGLGVRTLLDREMNNSLSENGEFGWDGALGCYLLCDPKTGIGLFYAQEEGGSPWWTWHGSVRNHVYACMADAL